MKEPIQQLIKLQEIDSRILAKRLFIDKVPGRISEQDEPLKLSRQNLEKMQQKSEALQKKKRDREKTLEDIQEKIKKMKARTPDIKTNKEYQAHLKEIESSEKEIGKIEEEVLLIMDDLDRTLKLQKTEEVVVRQELEKLEVVRKELDREVASHEKELSGLKAERLGIVNLIEPDVYTLYMRLLRAGGGIALSPAKNEVCGGCDMNMPPQLFVEVRKNEELLQCPQCQRILFYRED
ncbi:MAG: hypothetical protein C0402_05085 [Thermodesulfovibrio sp.]|nr:hypothetical protein [Thermodesulfovibrio sp.]